MRETKSTVTIRAAAGSDCDKVAMLLKTSGLPIDDISSDLPGFLVAQDGDVVVGAVGVEKYGNIGLLRSLAVATAQRNQKIGDRLFREAERLAKAEGIGRLYLLTTDADGYFAKRGFVPIRRNAAPGQITNHAQFTRLCPDSAIVMEKEL